MHVFDVVIPVGIPGDSLPGSLVIPRVKPEVTIIKPAVRLVVRSSVRMKILIS